jgi:hypothetical protein
LHHIAIAKELFSFPDPQTHLSAWSYAIHLACMSENGVGQHASCYFAGPSASGLLWQRHPERSHIIQVDDLAGMPNPQCLVIDISQHGNTVTTYNCILVELGPVQRHFVMYNM